MDRKMTQGLIIVRAAAPQVGWDSGTRHIQQANQHAVRQNRHRMHAWAWGTVMARMAHGANSSWRTSSTGDAAQQQQLVQMACVSHGQA